MSQQPQKKRLFVDTQTREILFLDSKTGQILPSEKRVKVNDHIEFENKGWMIIQDKPEWPDNKKPRSVTNQTVICSYCKNNIDEIDGNPVPLTSELETQKPEYIKTLQPPGYDTEGNPLYGIAIYKVIMNCSNGHHFVKYYREWVLPRAYDFLSHQEEIKLKLLDPLLS